MGDDIRILYNPNCSKCRTALGILEEHGVTGEVVEYLRTPPTAEELREILRLLGAGPRDIVRTNEPEYAEHGLDDPSLTDEDLIDAMARHPILIQRPIVVAGGKAVVGRPPERVLDILTPG